MLKDFCQRCGCLLLGAESSWIECARCQEITKNELRLEYEKTMDELE